MFVYDIVLVDELRDDVNTKPESIVGGFKRSCEKKKPETPQCYGCVSSHIASEGLIPGQVGSHESIVP